MKDYLYIFFGFMFIFCPFTIPFGVFLLYLGIEEIVEDERM